MLSLGLHFLRKTLLRYDLNRNTELAQLLSRALGQINKLSKFGKSYAVKIESNVRLHDGIVPP